MSDVFTKYNPNDPNSFDWNQFGAKDYTDLNTKTNGAADFIVNNVAKSPVVQQAIANSQQKTDEIPYNGRYALISSFPGIASKLGAGPDEVKAAQDWATQWNTQKNKSIMENNKEFNSCFLHNTAQNRWFSRRKNTR